MRICRIITSICLLISSLRGATGIEVQLKPDDWRRAEEKIARFKPGDFPNLPAELRKVLEDRGCTIPQPYNAGGQKKNVITGAFTIAGETDWAVLCSHEKRSAILVFSGERSSRQLAKLAEEADSQHLQVVAGAHEIGYSRVLTVATAQLIRQHFAHANHDGIEDTFLQKASVVWYRSGRKWVRFPGAD
ncbi:MAG: hypothetical protein WCG81_02160 [Candidatus Angelobacter sp.]